MGYTSEAYAVYGIKVHKDSLLVKTKVRSCSHNVDTSHKFCSECGNPIFTEKVENIAEEIQDCYPDYVGFFTMNADVSEGVIGFKLTSSNIRECDYWEIPQPKDEYKMPFMNSLKITIFHMMKAKLSAISTNMRATKAC